MARELAHGQRVSFGNGTGTLVGWGSWLTDDRRRRSGYIVRLDPDQRGYIVPGADVRTDIPVGLLERTSFVSHVLVALDGLEPIGDDQ